MKVSVCEKCGSRYVGEVCGACGGKGNQKPVAKVEVKKETKGK